MLTNLLKNYLILVIKNNTKIKNQKKGVSSEKNFKENISSFINNFNNK